VQNFVVSVAEAQLNESLLDGQGQPTPNAVLIEKFNLAFNVLFAVELAVNLYSNWLLRFLSNPWSLVDLTVVLLSLLTLGMPIAVLRLIRAFRVIRIFGRLGVLKKIISALTTSIYPLANAFIVLFVILSICRTSLHIPTR
jgi:hypothetical protein